MGSNSISPAAAHPLQHLSIQETAPPSPQDKWKHAFVPQASKRIHQPTCVDEFDENPNCCATAYDVEFVVEQAYEDGLEEHPGVKAIGGHPRPCVTSADLETLMDELAPLAYKKSPHPHIPGAPKKLDLSDPTGVGYIYEVRKFCVDLVKSTISHAYGNQESIPQKSSLGDRFEEVSRYCAKGVAWYFGITNMISNKLPGDKPLGWETTP